MTVCCCPAAWHLQRCLVAWLCGSASSLQDCTCLSPARGRCRPPSPTLQRARPFPRACQLPLNIAGPPLLCCHLAPLLPHCLCSLHAPFQESADATAYIGRLEASGEAVARWLAEMGPAAVNCIVPPPPDAGASAAGGNAASAPASEAGPSSGPDAAGGGGGEAAAAVAAAAAAVAGLHVGSGGGRGRAGGPRAERDLQEELAAEARWAASQGFSQALLVSVLAARQARGTPVV